MIDILLCALEEQDALCHHGILGQKWGDQTLSEL